MIQKMDKPIFIKRSIPLVLVICCLGNIAFGQQTASPFDLLPRIPQSSSADSTITISTSSNPFDKIQLQMDAHRRTSETPGFTVERRRKPVTAKEKTAIFQRFLFFTILTMMVILTLVVTVFRVFISKIWRAFKSDNMLSQLLREQSTDTTVAYLILYVMFFVNAGIFVFLALRYFNIKIAGNNISTLLLCIGGIAGFYAVKHLLLQIVKYIFPVEKEVSRYNFTVTVFNVIAGIFLVPMVLLIAYAPAGVTGFAIYLALGLLLLTIAFRALRGLFIANRFFAWHKFHFFLYLCAVEFAPLLVTIKLLNLY